MVLFKPNGKHWWTCWECGISAPLMRDRRDGCAYCEGCWSKWSPEETKFKCAYCERTSPHFCGLDLMDVPHRSGKECTAMMQPPSPTCQHQQNSHRAGVGSGGEAKLQEMEPSSYRTRLNWMQAYGTGYKMLLNGCKGIGKGWTLGNPLPTKRHGLVFPLVSDVNRNVSVCA